MKEKDTRKRKRARRTAHRTMHKTSEAGGAGGSRALALPPAYLQHYGIDPEAACGIGRFELPRGYLQHYVGGGPDAGATAAQAPEQHAPVDADGPAAQPVEQHAPAQQPDSEHGPEASQCEPEGELQAEIDKTKKLAELIAQANKPDPATPENMKNRDMNCANVAATTDAILAGADGAVALPGKVTSGTDLAKYFGQPPASWYRAGTDKNGIVRIMKYWGPGSRAVVFGERAGGIPGHFFNVANLDGDIEFFDGQLGTVSFEGYTQFTLLRTHGGTK
jgi:hypothetical protein